MVDLNWRFVNLSETLLPILRVEKDCRLASYCDQSLKIAGVPTQIIRTSDLPTLRML